MASVVYNKYKAETQKGNIDVVNDDIRGLLVKASPSGSPDNPDLATVTAVLGQCTECDFTNYTRKTLTSKVVTQDDGNDRSEYDFADLEWTSAGGATNNTVGALLLFKWVTNENDSIPISYHDFGDVTTDGTNLTLVVGSDGALHLT